MGSGVNRSFSGSYRGTGAQQDIKTPGFRPKRVVFFNETDLSTAEWRDTMADASFFQRVTAGTLSLVTTQGVTPLAAGFRVGTNATVNGSAKKIHFVAYE